MNKFTNYLNFMMLCKSARFYKSFKAFKFSFGNYGESILKQAWKRAKSEN